MDQTTQREHVEASMQYLIDHLVDRVPDISGALVSSADGFVLSSRLADGIDPSSVAAMSAATLGLSTKLVQLIGSAPAEVSIQRSSDGQVVVFAIPPAAALTVLAKAQADLTRLQIVGREVANGLERLFRGIT
jgi:predicted regulator of Ras-like GTPase activity (Roadblock/LC7/MglB family)